MYPAVSNYLNSVHQTRAIASYTEAVGEMDQDQREQMLAKAQQYNEALAAAAGVVPKELKERYETVLDVSMTGIMAYVEIPKIRVSLPIYHGTDEDVLQIAAGHLDWTSLPVGGPGTHCVISSHRGLPGAALFTRLDELEEGDHFRIEVLGETRTYEVDQIRTVVPQDTSGLQITDGEDYCTLMTCTPYGINTHRLLVRGHRVENGEGTWSIASEAVQIDPVIVAAVAAIPVLLILIVLLLLKRPKEKTRRRSDEDI